jgi:hypothetical protein
MSNHGAPPGPRCGMPDGGGSSPSTSSSSRPAQRMTSSPALEPRGLVRERKPRIKLPPTPPRGSSTRDFPISLYPPNSTPAPGADNFRWWDADGALPTVDEFRALGEVLTSAVAEGPENRSASEEASLRKSLAEFDDYINRYEKEKARRIATGEWNNNARTIRFRKVKREEERVQDEEKTEHLETGGSSSSTATIVRPKKDATVTGLRLNTPTSTRSSVQLPADEETLRCCKIE